MIRCDVAEYGTPDTDLEDLLHEWGRISLEQDAWLAFDPKGNLAGYAAVLPWGADIRYEFYSDPEWPGANLGRALLARCEERGPSFAAERGSPAEIKARTFIGHVNERDRQIVEEAGFGPGRRDGGTRGSSTVGAGFKPAQYAGTRRIAGQPIAADE